MHKVSHLQTIELSSRLNNSQAWNKEGKYFGQSFEDTDVLDSAVLIMPLVFFMQAVSLVGIEYLAAHLMLSSPILDSLVR